MVADGVFEPSLGLERRPEVAALSMSGSSFIVAVNALTLKRAHLPAHHDARRSEPSAPASGSTRSTS